MSKNSIRYPKLTPDLSTAATWRVIRYFGAGAILASVTIGSGETLFAARGGAVFGYALLWCFVGGAMMKGIQVYMAARYMTLTGAHPMEHWGHVPGPRNWVPIVIGGLSLLCFPFWLAGLPRFFGEIVNWIFGLGSENKEVFDHLAKLWGTLAIVVAVTLTWLQTYKVLEKVQTFILAMLLLSIAAACVASQPDWVNAVVGAVVPTVPQYEDWIATKYPKIAARSPWVEVGVYLGAIGGGTYDYIGYIGCLREKAWGAIGVVRSARSLDPQCGEALTADGAKSRLLNDASTFAIDIDPENVKRGRRWLLPAKIDTATSFLSVLIFTVCFAVLGAVILHPLQKVPSGRELFTHQAGFLTTLHGSLLYLYQVGIFMAFWGSIYGAYELYTRTAYECVTPLSRRLRQAPVERIRIAVLLYCALGGLVLLWTVEDPVQIVTPAAIVGGVLTCGLWCFAMIWVDRHFLPRPLRMGKTLVVLAILSGVAMTMLGLKSLWDYTATLVSLN